MLFAKKNPNVQISTSVTHYQMVMVGCGLIEAQNHLIFSLVIGGRFPSSIYGDNRLMNL